MENGRRGGAAERLHDIPHTVALARGLIHAQRMAKTKKRLGTASIDQSAPARREGGNGEHTEPGESARDRIALRAYELYLARGRADGSAFDDWLAAERELAASHAHHGSDRGE